MKWTSLPWSQELLDSVKSSASSSASSRKLGGGMKNLSPTTPTAPILKQGRTSVVWLNHQLVSRARRSQ